MTFFMNPRQRQRLRRYIVLCLLLSLVYYFWPVEQIEQISDTLTTDQLKNDYLEEILNPSKSKNNDNNNGDDSDEVIYNTESDPQKVNFNPDSKDLDVPTVINLENVNKALNSLQLKPLSDNQKPVTGKVDVLSDTITAIDYTPISKLTAFIGNKDENKSTDYYSDLTCQDITYEPKNVNRQILYSEPIILEDDMIEIRRHLMNSKYKYAVTEIDKESAGDDLISNISHWHRTSGSSIWLPDEQLHIMVSTVMYAPTDKSDPIISFIRLQLFDSNWKEVKNRRIRYSELTEKDIDTVLRDYTKNKEDSTLDRISIKFPSFLNIPIDIKSAKKNLGPEDPRIIYKDGEYSSEPIIIFNMATGKDKRNMFAIFPFRKPTGADYEHSLLKFKNVGNQALTTLKTEKNWTPFFDSFKIGDSVRSRGNIHFIYTMDPLVILRCSLDSGKCTKLQDNIYYSTFAKKSEAFIRGGTSFTPIPRQIVQTLNDGDYQKRLQMWIGFPKVLIKDTPCKSNFYRPSLALLIKEDGLFRMELITSPLDFQLPVSKECDSKKSSVLAPNGIAMWDITTTDIKEKGDLVPLFKDYLGLMVGERDENVEIVFLKNVLNYVMGVYSDGKYMLGEYDLEGGVMERTRKVAECGLGSAISYASGMGDGSTEGNIQKEIDK